MALTSFTSSSILSVSSAGCVIVTNGRHFVRVCCQAGNEIRLSVCCWNEKQTKKSSVANCLHFTAASQSLLIDVELMHGGAGRDVCIYCSRESRLDAANCEKR